MRSDTTTRALFGAMPDFADLAGPTGGDTAVTKEKAMSHSRHRDGGRRPGRRGRSRDDGRDPTTAEDRHTEMLADLDPSLLTEEERAIAEAKVVAEEKVELYREGAKVLIFAVALGIWMPFVGFLIFAFGGIKVARQAYRLLYEPKLRDRLIGDEVRKRVSTSVNEERQQMEGEHARSLEKLSASIAHEIRNPITAAKSLVQQMNEEPTDVDNAEYARVALQELERVERSISHLLRYAREEEMRLAQLHMSDVLDSALETFRDRAEREGVEIVRQFDNAGPMRGDAEQLRRVVINLVGNALDAVSVADREKPRVLVAMGENLAGTEVWVRIADNGHGMDEAERERVFNPFVTTKTTGTGLGLPIVKRIVEAHGGVIELGSTPGEGAEFVMTFPKPGAGAGA
jgi:signal transduction histidine kinase